MTQHIEGLVAATMTPMTDDGELNLDVIGTYAEFVVRNGMAGIFVCGSSGEGMSLSVPERMDVAERWRETLDDQVKVIVHVGHASLADSRTLAEHARKIGADAVGAIGPIYHKAATVADLADHCALIAAACPELPFYYYHIPVLSGVKCDMADFLPAASRRIPNLAGVKFTDENLMDYALCAAMEDGRFDMLFGRDEILLCALALGARGAIGTTYNYAAPVYRKVMDRYAAGDVEGARAAQLDACRLVEVLRTHGGLRVSKAAMAMLGVDCGPLRSPLRSPSDGQLKIIRAELEAVGFFDFACK